MKKAMIEQLVLGMVGTNTWLIKNKENNELLIIDPADESARIEEKIDRMGGIPVAVLLTHGHFDHMLAADDLRDEYGIPIIACAAEQQVLTDSIKNLSGSWASAHVLLADQWVCDGKNWNLPDFSSKFSIHRDIQREVAVIICRKKKFCFPVIPYLHRAWEEPIFPQEAAQICRRV